MRRVDGSPGWVVLSGKRELERSFNISLPLNPTFQNPSGFRIIFHLLQNVSYDSHVFLTKATERLVTDEVILRRVVVVGIGPTIWQKGTFLTHGNRFCKGVL